MCNDNNTNNMEQPISWQPSELDLCYRNVVATFSFVSYNFAETHTHFSVVLSRQPKMTAHRQGHIYQHDCQEVQQTTSLGTNQSVRYGQVKNMQEVVVESKRKV